MKTADSGKSAVFLFVYAGLLPHFLLDEVELFLLDYDKINYMFS
jgi:hypothetical protein